MGYNNIQNRSSISKISVNRDDESNVNSTRKLLGDELDRSDAKVDKRKLPMMEHDVSHEESFQSRSFRKSKKKLDSKLGNLLSKDVIMESLKKKAIKDIYNL